MRVSARNVVLALVGLVALVGGGVTAHAWEDRAVRSLPDDLPVEVLAVDPSIALPYPVVVAAANGCPAYAFSSARPDPGGYGIDTGRTFRLSTTPLQAVLVTCLPEAGGSAEAVVAGHLSTPVVEGSSIVDGPVLVPSAFGDAYRIETRIGSSLLREWYTDHDGVVVAVGLLYRSGVEPDAPVVEAMLASWQWR